MPGRRPRKRTGRRKLLAAVATGVAGIGIGLNVLRPSAYTSAVASRGASADVAADKDAVLGMEGLDDPSVTPTFTNRSSASMDVTLNAEESDIEWDVGDDGSYDSDPVTVGISSGASKNVAVKGADTVTVDITAIRSSNDATTGRIELQRTIDVPQSNVVQQIQGSAKAAGNSGKYEFDLENTGNVDVTLVGIGVKETTNPNATQVDSGGILLAGGQSVLSTKIPIDSSSPDQDSRVDFDQTVPLGSGQSTTFEFDRFRTSGYTNAKMKDEDVRATFYFGDGSSGDVELCLKGCSF